MNEWVSESINQSLLRFLDDSKGDWIGEEQLYHAGHYRPHCPVGPPDRRCSIAQRLRLADSDSAKSRSRALSRASRQHYCTTALLHYCTTATSGLTLVCCAGSKQHAAHIGARTAPPEYSVA